MKLFLVFYKATAAGTKYCSSTVVRAWDKADAGKRVLETFSGAFEITSVISK